MASDDQTSPLVSDRRGSTASDRSFSFVAPRKRSKDATSDGGNSSSSIHQRATSSNSTQPLMSPSISANGSSSFRFDTSNANERIYPIRGALKPVGSTSSPGALHSETVSGSGSSDIAIKPSNPSSPATRSSTGRAEVLPSPIRSPGPGDGTVQRELQSYFESRSDFIGGRPHPLSESSEEGEASPSRQQQSSAATTVTGAPASDNNTTPTANAEPAVPSQDGTETKTTSNYGAQSAYAAPDEEILIEYVATA